MSQPSTYIIGIDPGLRITGYGVLSVADDEPSLAEGGVIKSDASAPLEQRLRQIHAGLEQVLERFPPRVMVVEDLWTQYEHPRTAVLMGHARGVIYLTAAQVGTEVVAYAPALVKRSLTGNGRAPKEQVARMVTQMLGLAKPPRPADVTDALALALCHCVPARTRIARPRRRRKQLPEAIAKLIEDSEGS
jgi:crossover junction endodeoxyribonuclease RuvC